ncbi:hypothetical protein RJ641_007343 [Dillenia turbinata]|uniref:Translocation protein SEC62 n=1 Tax=Dillenia turbinata TaxID=194707 RepID=A0AAN8V667_9MAGN
MQKQVKKDVFQLFAEKVRDHKDLESRWAVLQETRVEYFRGKDFVSFMKNHPELKDVLESDKNLDVEDIGNALLRKNLLVRCDRVVKTVRPGKRKLSTWPAHLEIFPFLYVTVASNLLAFWDHVPFSTTDIIGVGVLCRMFVIPSAILVRAYSVLLPPSNQENGSLFHVLIFYLSLIFSQDQIFSEIDAFFAWTFVKRRPLWQTLLSFMWPVLTLAICLFPVYPHQAKLLILYSCAGILLLILSLLLAIDLLLVGRYHILICFLLSVAVRATIFGALYVILGKRVWFFPNILAEEATLGELFRFWPKKDEEERPKWMARLFYAIVAVLVILLLRHHAPDEAARARYQKRVSNIIDDVLEWSPTLALSGMMEKQEMVNVTESKPDFTNETKGSFENVSPNGVDEETSSMQNEDDVIETMEDADDHEHLHQDST